MAAVTAQAHTTQRVGAKEVVPRAGRRTDMKTNQGWTRVSCSLRLLVFQTHASSGIQKGRVGLMYPFFLDF